MVLDHRGNQINRQVSASRPQRMDDLRREDRRYVKGYDAYHEAASSEHAPRHWKYADTLSATAANSPLVRKILRNRVRYEVANNSYAEGIVDTDTQFVIGKGPRVQFKMPDADEGQQQQIRKAERLFNQWMRHRRVDLPGTLRTMWRARLQDGEPLAKLTTRKRDVMGISLRVDLIECDRLTTPMNLWGANKPEVDGIELNSDGEPETYIILRDHPGDSDAWTDYNAYDRVDADNIIHWFKKTRPEQYRGIPELAPALPLFAQLRRYTLATLTAAEVASDMALYLQTDAPPGDPVPVDPYDSTPMDMDRGMITALPAGWKLDQMQGTQPTTEYPNFKREIVTEMARCISMPYNIAACDSSDYNYASGRLDHQTYFNRINVLEEDCTSKVLAPIVEAWFKEARPKFGLDITAQDINIEAYWSGQRHVDPKKEAQANEVALQSGATTLDEIYAETGRDVERELERAAETLGMEVSEYKQLIIRNLFESDKREINDTEAE